MLGVPAAGLFSVMRTSIADTPPIRVSHGNVLARLLCARPRARQHDFRGEQDR